jgi:hypothetical protein
MSSMAARGYKIVDVANPKGGHRELLPRFGNR